MAFVSESDKARIRQAIERAERRSHGELVTVIAGRADDYPFIPALWAALFAFAVPPLGRMTGFLFEAGDWGLVQLAVFAGVGALFLLTPLKFRLVPRAVMARRASGLAHEQFVKQGVHLTAGHTGILLFVSVAERYVEVIADKGISEGVPPQYWQEIVDGFTQRVRENRVADGFVEAIDALGELLATHLPPVVGGDNPNELADRLVEL